MKRRKKKGSSMVMVIAIFGILIIVGIAILGAVTASYKLRVEENNKIKNLYGAESGIDEAYVRMCTVVDEAIKEGIKEAEADVDVEGKASNVTFEDRNDKFKSTFRKYLAKNLEYKVKPSDKNPIIVGKLENKTDLENKDVKSGLFNITSTFTDKKNKSKTVKVDYTIQVPESYKEKKINSIIDYSLATDKNLDISENKNGEINIKGNVWVQGDKPETANFNNKYSAGIDIKDSNVIFEDNVYTARNINVNSNANVQLGLAKGDSEPKKQSEKINEVYAENLRLGDVDGERKVQLEGISADLYLANDLVVACSDAKFNINKLYAFNDKNEKDDMGKQLRSSSCIIINSMEWPKNDKVNLTVKDTAYLMGVAYINTNEKAYQTGESVAYKGNYKAYSVPIMDEDYNSEQFEYINPLMLITKNSNGEELELSDKVKHFMKYSENNQLRTSGISLPKDTYAAGVYVSSNKVAINNVEQNKNEDGVVQSKQATNPLEDIKKDYIEKVYNMGVKGSYEQDDFYYGNVVKTVSNQIDWDGVKKIIEENKSNVIELKESNIIVILNHDEYRNITIKNNIINLGDMKISENNGGDTKNKKYIVVSAGNVECNSSLGFNGMIVSKKNISIKGSSKTVGAKINEKDIKSESDREILASIFSTEEYGRGENKVIYSQDLIETGKWTLVK